MATLFRICRLVNNNGNKLLPKNDFNIIRTITSRHTPVEDRPPKPAPYPYKEKPYNLFHYFFDKTTARLDENSKLLVVEGPIASGKTKFAKELADELGMLYLPEANLDMIYINDYGYDLRKLDPQLPDSCKSFDVMDFLKNPNHKLTARYQIMQYYVRYSQYIDALAHILSTGQGVILDRCCYSDYIFVEAMFSQGYISKPARRKYYEFRDNTISELLRPHLIIYLDIPTNKVLENVQKRAITYEKSSPVITPAYINVMEKQYKQHYLKEMNTHSELLIYDWSDGGEVEIVVEDIERIDFNRYDKHDPKIKEWVHSSEEDYACLRHKYADKKQKLLNYFNVPTYEVPELCVSATDDAIYSDVMDSAPGHKYEKGYNAELGDTGLLFKIAAEHRETLPLRERRQV